MVLVACFFPFILTQRRGNWRWNRQEMWKKRGILKEQVLTRITAVKASCGLCRFQQLGVASEEASRQILRGARAGDRAGDQTFALWACQLPAVALFNSMTP